MAGRITEAGLGWEHQQDRAAKLAAFVDGMPCPICHRKMHAWQALDLHHLIDRVYGGIGGPTALAHRSCNRRSGQRVSVRRARARGSRKAQVAAIRYATTPASGKAASTARRARRRW